MESGGDNNQSIMRDLLLQDVLALRLNLIDLGVELESFDPNQLSTLSSSDLKRLKKDWDHLSRTLSSANRS